MKVFTALYALTDAADRARELRDAGASGVATFEGAHDVFAPLTLAATVPGLDSDDQCGYRVSAQPDSPGTPGQ